ncbi:MAG TPA: helix-turn-helix domain-containing protein [Nevskia sp.]|nr:helix-turn-helix domain-containing protein [Nevskia sp.]
MNDIEIAETSIARAARLAGGQNALAHRIGVSKAFINQLVRGERPVPAERCIAIEEAVGGQVTRYDLRPDVFGTAAPTQAEANAA